MAKQKKEVKKDNTSKKSTPLKKDTLEELEGGIKVALSRGQELKPIMVSYYNAGYKKEDIQEAAKRAQQEKIKVVEKSKEEKGSSDTKARTSA
jgi:dihydroorotase